MSRKNKKSKNNQLLIGKEISSLIEKNDDYNNEKDSSTKLSKIRSRSENLNLALRKIKQLIWTAVPTTNPEIAEELKLINSPEKLKEFIKNNNKVIFDKEIDELTRDYKTSEIIEFIENICNERIFLQEEASNLMLEKYSATNNSVKDQTEKLEKQEREKKDKLDQRVNEIMAEGSTNKSNKSQGSSIDRLIKRDKEEEDKLTQRVNGIMGEEIVNKHEILLSSINKLMEQINGKQIELGDRASKELEKESATEDNRLLSAMKELIGQIEKQQEKLNEQVYEVINRQKQPESIKQKSLLLALKARIETINEQEKILNGKTNQDIVGEGKQSDYVVLLSKLDDRIKEIEEEEDKLITKAENFIEKQQQEDSVLLRLNKTLRSIEKEEKKLVERANKPRGSSGLTEPSSLLLALKMEIEELKKNEEELKEEAKRVCNESKEKGMDNIILIKIGEKIEVIEKKEKKLTNKADEMIRQFKAKNPKEKISRNVTKGNKKRSPSSIRPRNHGQNSPRPK